MSEKNLISYAQNVKGDFDIYLENRTFSQQKTPAIRIILYLSMKGGIISSKELSETMKIPENYVLEVARKLTRAGLTRTYVGKNGGFAVNKPAQQIDLLSIIEIMENTVKINRCLEEDEYCSRFATATCPVRSFYCILQDELESKLSSITIKSLLDGSKE